MCSLVQELSAVAPRPRTVPALARRLQVSERTVQRDLQALLATGVPVRNAAGRGGGWFVDAGFGVPAVRLSGLQALAVVAALTSTNTSTPLNGPAREAIRAITGAMKQSTAGNAA